MSPYVLNVVKWTVDTLYTFPNVYYEVANEPEWIQPLRPAPCTGWTTQSTTVQTTVATWQNAIAAELKAEISAKGASQQVGIEASTFTDADQFRSGTRPTQPGHPPAGGPGPYTSSASIINSHYTRLNPPTSTSVVGDGLGAIRLARGYYSQTKILGFNETKIVASSCAEKRGTIEGVNEGRVEAWEFMVNQGGVYNQFGYGCPSSCSSTPASSSNYCETRREMGALRQFSCGAGQNRHTPDHIDEWRGTECPALMDQPAVLSRAPDDRPYRYNIQVLGCGSTRCERSHKTLAALHSP